MNALDEKKEKRFKTEFTLILAGLTFITSLIVLLNVNASNHSAAATRDGRLLGIRYLSHLGRSLWNAAGEKDLMNSYLEASGLIMQTQVYERMAQGSDAAFYKMMQDSLAKSRALLLGQSELAKPPYFDPRSGAFDFFQYYLDRVYIPAVELQEREEQKWAEGAFWGSKSEAYTAGLAVMAVAVFLLTLSLVIHAHVRVIIAPVGAALVAAVLGFSGYTTIRQWHGPAENSIKDLAKASGYTLSAQMAIAFFGNTDAAAEYAAQAKKAVDKILEIESRYPAAILLRARVHTVLGETLYYAGKREAARAELEQAAMDLERAIKSGKTEGYAYWSKGYVNYLLGRHAEALAAFDQALALLPRQKFTLGLVKAAALINAGKIKDAQALAEEAIEFALKTPLGGDAVNIRTIIKNLERFNELKPVDGLPAMILRLKEASVCLAVLNKARPAEVKAEIAPPRFVAPVYDNAGTMVDSPAVEEFKSGTARAYFQLELKGMEKGQSIVRKVYRRAPGQVFWIEQLWLGRAEQWDGPPEARLMGSVENRIPEAGETLLAGDYRLEIYIEGGLKTSGNFKIL
jgi:tetratricopeptide (TPR) repeat protein